MNENQIERTRQRLLRIPDVARQFNVSRTSLYDNVFTDPRFPKPLKIGKLSLWRQADIDEYVELLAASDSET